MQYMYGGKNYIEQETVNVRYDIFKLSCTQKLVTFETANV